MGDGLEVCRLDAPAVLTCQAARAFGVSGVAQVVDGVPVGDLLARFQQGHPVRQPGADGAVPVGVDSAGPGFAGLLKMMHHVHTLCYSRYRWGDCAQMMLL
jgi:hypothetical protein